MIDDNKIKEAGQKYSQRFYYGSTALYGFIAGAKWIQEEFLKNLWHQINKEPEGYDEWILLHYNIGNYYSLAQVKDFKSWKGFVDNAPIDGWLYIDDLFSE